eukprot:364224-Chlamydomonas_euryale.AAC.10
MSPIRPPDAPWRVNTVSYQTGDTFRECQPGPTLEDSAASVAFLIASRQHQSARMQKASAPRAYR